MVKLPHFQVFLILCVTITINLAIPNENEFLKLIDDVEEQFCALSKSCNKLAAGLLFPNYNWYYWAYVPSADGDGAKPVIDGNLPTAPPDESTYGTYLAAGLDTIEDDEIFEVIKHLDTLYDAYRIAHGNPKAICIYTTYIPCFPDCTEQVIEKLQSDPYNSIETKIVVYNNCGSCSDECEAAKEAFDKAEITLINH